ELAGEFKPLVDECTMIATGFRDAATAEPRDRCEAMLDGIATNIAQCRWRSGSADRLLAGLYVGIVGVGPLRARVPIRVDWLALAVARPTGTWAELVAAQFRAWQPWVGTFVRSPALIEAARAQGCESQIGGSSGEVGDRA